jgi:hypothetical protein
MPLDQENQLPTAEMFAHIKFGGVYTLTSQLMVSRTNIPMSPLEAVKAEGRLYPASGSLGNYAIKFTIGCIKIGHS